MFSTYEEYQQCSGALTLEEMERLHQDIAAEVSGDEDALELLDELLEKANEYCNIRARWALMTREQKMEIDERRTSCHDSLIVKFNMLARYLKMQGKPAAWRDTLGHLEDDPANRKRIGDFACYLVFINSINAR
ncbi:hypothetical protein ACTQWG_07015 [Blautia sp. HCP3S3_H10_1]|uniref:hypothetical protein n=1 Tax=unclassified Blautia TaxID=2648079 RepID=UPI003F8F47C6|nr:hypothetical protein [Clostridia bacterium]